MRLRTIAAVTAAAALVLVAATGPDTITVTNVSVAGTTATVTGNVTFAARSATADVGGEKATGTLGGSAAGTAAGLDLQKATITEIPNGLRFTWHVSNLPDTGIIPEGVRYNWAFKIGSDLYQLQAKSSNLVGVTTAEDPVGHAQQAAAQRPFFQLRGACVTSYQGTPSNGCYHLAFLSGSVNAAAKTISMDLPYETKDAIGRVVAPNFKPGAVIVDNAGEGTASMTIAASFQAAVSNTITSQYINGFNPYYVGGYVGLAVSSATANPPALNYTKATLTGDSFSGSVGGVTAAARTLYIRACKGVVCSYDSVTLP